MGDMDRPGACAGGMDGDNEAVGSGGLAKQSVTEKGIPDADNASPDGMSRASTTGSSDQTPPLTSRGGVCRPGGGRSVPGLPKNPLRRIQTHGRHERGQDHGYRGHAKIFGDTVVGSGYI